MKCYEPPNRVNRKERRERKGNPPRDLQSLCGRVRQIHMYDGHGHLEKVYENALAHRLRKAGLDVKQQYAWSQDGTCRKSKPTFLLSAVSAFFAFFAV